MELEYEVLMNIKERYDSVDCRIVKGNIKRFVKDKRITHKEMCTVLGVSEHTAYSYTKDQGNKPALVNLLLLGLYMGIDWDEFIREFLE